jgi:hypothetical protein
VQLPEVGPIQETANHAGRDLLRAVPIELVPGHTNWWLSIGAGQRSLQTRVEKPVDGALRETYNEFS